jgi:hypothetical protein|nr:MAG TPA: hypothetical protein [Caudoviricetes sp.]
MFYHGKIKDSVVKTIHSLPYRENPLRIIRELLVERHQSKLKCDRLEQLLKKNGLSPRRTGKDISHLREELRQSHVSITYYNFMVERYVLKLVEEMPIKIYRPNANMIKVISDFVYKDRLPKHKFKSPVLQAMSEWVGHF